MSPVNQLGRQAWGILILQIHMDLDIKNETRLWTKKCFIKNYYLIHKTTASELASELGDSILFQRQRIRHEQTQNESGIECEYHTPNSDITVAESELWAQLISPRSTSRSHRNRQRTSTPTLLRNNSNESRNQSNRDSNRSLPLPNRNRWIIDSIVALCWMPS